MEAYYYCGFTSIASARIVTCGALSYQADLLLSEDKLNINSNVYTCYGKYPWTGTRNDGCDCRCHN